MHRLTPSEKDAANDASAWEPENLLALLSTVPDRKPIARFYQTRFDNVVGERATPFSNPKPPSDARPAAAASAVVAGRPHNELSHEKT